MDRSPRSLVSIDLGAVRHNVAFMRSRTAAGTRFMAAVKADAYGHGAVPVARAVLDAGGYGLAVATAEEAVELRDAGITAPVLVMGPLYGLDQLVEMARRDVEVAVVSPDVGEMLAHLPSVGTPLRVHVKIDTGMNRQGLYPGREFETFLDTVRVARNVKVVGVMTHFANAAAEPNLVAQQLQRFYLLCGTRARHLSAGVGARGQQRGHRTLPRVALRYGALRHRHSWDVALSGGRAR